MLTWVRRESHALFVNKQVRKELLHTHTPRLCLQGGTQLHPVQTHFFLHQNAEILVQGTVCMHNSSEHQQQHPQLRLSDMFCARAHF